MIKLLDCRLVCSFEATAFPDVTDAPEELAVSLSCLCVAQFSCALIVDTPVLQSRHWSLLVASFRVPH